ncbi:SRPBCC family protein [Paenibacillus ferrarius]|uniref:SRPBCC family protein n=1 Tax=Paenibacillus ferrarius TaxID=1469647 RepID=UPI003D280896
MTKNQNANEAEQNAQDAEFVITRIFNAPRELVFQLWTQPEHLANWWGPTGMALSVLACEVRPDGFFHFRMSSPDGHNMWAKFVYREVKAPDTLVYVSSFADAEGSIIRPAFSPVFPLEIVNEISFAEEDGKTILTLRSYPIHATEEEIRFFASMNGSMNQGFGGTFDQLDAYLTNVR